MSDFNYAILDVTSHRPWPMPDRPWIMTQTWHALLFAHWPVEERVLRSLVPAPLPIDVFEGQGWLGVVPFHMTNVAPRGVPSMPLLSSFPELNVRTYVTVDGKPGVYFFSLDAASAPAVAAARALFGLPYHVAEMQVETDRDDVMYTSRRKSSEAAFVARYRAVGAVRPPEPGTLEYFLTERYCLYTADRSSRVHRVNIHHPRWALQSADADIEVNTMAGAAGIALPATRPLLHFARRQDTVAFAPERT
jgi:uncharacterized protein YqjF (DUF2071 family)